MATMLSIAGYLFLLFVVVVSAYIAVEAYYYQCCLGPALERDLGFREGATYLRVGRRLHSAVAITGIAEGGVFAQAGVRPGDVLPDVSHTGLFKMLHRNRGRMAELAVVDGGEGPPFSARPRRIIPFAVPRLNGPASDAEPGAAAGGGGV